MNAYQPPNGESSPIPDEEAVRLRKIHRGTEWVIETIALGHVSVGAFLLAGTVRVLLQISRGGWQGLTPPLMDRARHELHLKALILSWFVATAFFALTAGVMLARLRRSGVAWSLLSFVAMFGPIVGTLTSPSERNGLLPLLAILLAGHGLFFLDSPRTVMTAQYREEVIGRTPRLGLFMYLVPLAVLVAVVAATS